MITKSKAQTFIGFAVRSGKCRTGTNSIQTLKKANLVILCKSATENSKKQVMKIAKGLGAKMLITEQKLLEEYIFKAGVKVLAITDKSLADAIYDNAKEEFNFVCLGE